MNKIVLEDFNEGNGYYKINLAYLNKEQVEEIEALVSKWNPTDEDIKNCIGMCLTDVNEQRFKNYGTNLKDCLAWLNKQNKSTSVKWSEEDEKIYQTIIDDTVQENQLDGNQIHWLKTLRYKSIHQPKWTEEDDAYKLFAISAVEDYYDEENPLQKYLVAWLKSLKQRMEGEQ